MNSMSFGELNICRTIQENTKRMNSRRLQNTPELNQSGPQKNIHLEGTRDPHVKAELGLGPA
jgi:hypothetical protein